MNSLMKNGSVSGFILLTKTHIFCTDILWQGRIRPRYGEWNDYFEKGGNMFYGYSSSDNCNVLVRYMEKYNSLEYSCSLAVFSCTAYSRNVFSDLIKFK